MQISFQTAIHEGKEKGCLCPAKPLPCGAGKIGLAEYWTIFLVQILGCVLCCIRSKQDPFGHQVAQAEN